MGGESNKITRAYHARYNLLQSSPVMGNNRHKSRSQIAIFSVNVVHKTLIEHITSHLKEPIIEKYTWREILSDEFKPIAVEKYEFENRQNRKINWTYSHVQLINIPI